jgi:hypothetical protein
MPTRDARDFLPRKLACQTRQGETNTGNMKISTLLFVVIHAAFVVASAYEGDPHSTW